MRLLKRNFIEICIQNVICEEPALIQKNFARLEQFFFSDAVALSLTITAYELIANSNCCKS